MVLARRYFSGALPVIPVVERTGSPIHYRSGYMHQASPISEADTTGPWWLLLLATLFLVELTGAWLLYDQTQRDARGWTRKEMSIRLEAMAQCQAFASRYVVDRAPGTRASFVRPHRQPDEVVEQQVSPRGHDGFVVLDTVVVTDSSGVTRQEYRCVARHRGGSDWRVETFELGYPRAGNATMDPMRYPPWS